MVELETERLRLLPLTVDHLMLLLADRPALERALGVAESGETLPEELRQAIERDMLPGAATDEANTLWYTEWEIVLKAEGRIIGGLGFKGPPGPSGEVEIGYGLQPAHRGRGYMAEAVRAALGWAFGHSAVQVVTAEVERDNGPSLRLAQRLGLTPFAEKDPFTYWRITRQAFEASPPPGPPPAAPTPPR